MSIDTRKLQLVRVIAWGMAAAIFWTIAAISAFSQVPDEPKICISQAAANKCGENARLVPALEAKIAELEAALKEKQKNEDELKETNRKNVAELTERVHKTEGELATKTGQLIGAEAMVTRLTAVIDFMLKNGREKCYALICVQ